ncbi:cytochrome P450 [Hypoxylon crocopeplum]|nr:cytochrome P450 [Hypoxylon crocopeplum]
MSSLQQLGNIITELQLWDSKLLSFWFGPFLLVLTAWSFWGFGSQADMREPPILKPRVPLVGHAWGLFKSSHGYLESMCHKSGLPIYTLPLLHKKVYVINSPIFVSAAFSNKNLSFGPFIIDFVQRMEELSVTARRAYSEEGMHTKLMQIFSMYMTGRYLRSMNSVQLEEIFRYLPGCGPGVETENLWIWLRDILTLGKTTMLLGSRNNPWKNDHSLIEDYWNFEANPSRRFNLTGVKNRSSSKSHRILLAALQSYFDAGHDMSTDTKDADVAQMTRETGAMQREAGFTTTDIAAAHVVIIHGGLVSVVPTIFWAAMYLFCDPDLLTQARKDALAAVTVTVNQSTGRREACVSHGRLEDSCPFLASVLRETQRLVAVGTLHRRVLEDTELSGGIGGERTQNSGVMRRVSLDWGGSKQMTPPGQETSSRQPTLQSAKQSTNMRKKAYFPFGGGKDLCPGRQLAIAETLSTLVVLSLGFDITAPDGTTMKLPAFSTPKITSQTARPHESSSLRARIKRRAGWEDVIWSVSQD